MGMGKGKARKLIEKNLGGEKRGGPGLKTDKNIVRNSIIREIVGLSISRLVWGRAMHQEAVKKGN